ncbi:MAG: peptidoglycan DD-metalloendopeptidase family protein [Magnetovibrio sp.]|nr:peptidoglycan DD-metalloendopeptidase family protein [Magnetovibrio sp.]
MMATRATATGLTLGVLFAFFLAVSPATAQQAPAAKPNVTADKLQKTRKALDKARDESQKLKDKAADLEQDIVRIREGLVAAARIIQHHEARVGELQARLDALGAKQSEIKVKFDARRRQLGYVLAALQRMARNPPEALIAQPASPADTVRSAILLRSALPELKAQARALQLDLEALRAARTEAERRRIEFDGEMKKLDGQRLVLQRLLGRKSRLRRRTILQTNRATRRANALAKETASLLELVTRLDALRTERERVQREQQQKLASSTRRAPKTDVPVPQGPPPGFTGRPFLSAKGRLPHPAIGRVVARYGQPIAKGRTHKGLTLETARAAQIIAPFEGKVAFSGPFRGYGQLLIIEHSGGYHTLLAGMARIDVAVGHWVLVGEPIGIMGREKARKPALYLEIRKKGQPINPLPWLATRKRKVSG